MSKSMCEEACLERIKHEIAMSRELLTSALECISKPNKDYGKASYIISRVAHSAYRAIEWADEANYEEAKKRCDEVWNKHE